MRNQKPERYLAFLRFRGNQGEFDAFTHGVYAFGADTDLVAEVPFELLGFGAASAAPAAVAAE